MIGPISARGSRETRGELERGEAMTAFMREAFPDDFFVRCVQDTERLEAKITARFHRICAGLEHPDLKRAAAAATNLSCFLYSCCPTTDLYDFHPYYVLDADIVEYRKNPKRTTSTFYIDRSDYSNDYSNEPCLLYTSPSPRDGLLSRMPSSA